MKILLRVIQLRDQKERFSQARVDYRKKGSKNAALAK